MYRLLTGASLLLVLFRHAYCSNVEEQKEHLDNQDTDDTSEDSFVDYFDPTLISEKMNSELFTALELQSVLIGAEPTEKEVKWADDFLVNPGDCYRHEDGYTVQRNSLYRMLRNDFNLLQRIIYDLQRLTYKLCTSIPNYNQNSWLRLKSTVVFAYHSDPYTMGDPLTLKVNAKMFAAVYLYLELPSHDLSSVTFDVHFLRRKADERIEFDNKRMLMNAEEFAFTQYQYSKQACPDPEFDFNIVTNVQEDPGDKKQISSSEAPQTLSSVPQPFERTDPDSSPRIDGFKDPFPIKDSPAPQVRLAARNTNCPIDQQYENRSDDSIHHGNPRRGHSPANRDHSRNFDNNNSNIGRSPNHLDDIPRKNTESSYPYDSSYREADREAESAPRDRYRPIRNDRYKNNCVESYRDQVHSNNSMATGLGEKDPTGGYQKNSADSDNRNSRFRGHDYNRDPCTSSHNNSSRRDRKRERSPPQKNDSATRASNIHDNEQGKFKKPRIETETPRVKSEKLPDPGRFTVLEMFLFKLLEDIGYKNEPYIHPRTFILGVMKSIAQKIVDAKVLVPKDDFKISKFRLSALIEAKNPHQWVPSYFKGDDIYFPLLAFLTTNLNGSFEDHVAHLTLYIYKLAKLCPDYPVSSPIHNYQTEMVLFQSYNTRKAEYVYNLSHIDDPNNKATFYVCRDKMQLHEKINFIYRCVTGTALPNKRSYSNSNHKSVFEAIQDMIWDPVITADNCKSYNVERKWFDQKEKISRFIPASSEGLDFFGIEPQSENKDILELGVILWNIATALGRNYCPKNMVKIVNKDVEEAFN